MGDEDQPIKNIKVSEQVHDELSARKYKDETFDEVLKRELGLVPQTIQDLTVVLPDRLAAAVNGIVEDYVDNEFRKIGSAGELSLTLQYVAPTTHKVIYEVVVYLPEPGVNRRNHRIDINYRNPTGEIERIAKLSDTEEDAVTVEEYKDSETYEKKPNTRKGKHAGANTAELVGPSVSDFVGQAREQWG